MKRLRGFKPTLLKQFSIVSLVLITILGIALAWGIQAQLERNALEQEAENVADQASSLIGPNMKVSDLTATLSPSRYAQIDALIRQRLFTKHIVRAKIWNRQGVLIYSDDKALLGKQFPVDGDLEEAFGGENAMDVSSLTDAENVDERKRFDKLLEIYVPLRPADATRPEGAFEVYHDMDTLQKHIDETRLFVFSSLGFGFLALYGLLFTLVRNASRTLAKRTVENAILYDEATQQLAERQRAEEEIKRQLDRLAALRNIDVAIIASLDFRLTLKLILEQITNQLHVDAADVLLLNTKTHLLEYAAGRGFRYDSIARFALRLGQGYAGRAALNRQTVWLSDVTQVNDIVGSHVPVEEGFVSYCVVPLLAKGQVKGVLEVHNRTKLEPEQDWLAYLETLAGQVAIAVDNATLFDDLQRSNDELALAYDTTLEGWSRALDLRDRETEGHTRRVTDMTLLLARAMGMGESELLQIRRGALLHDIGKMGIPDAILLKPGPLTDQEWEIMRRHPIYAHALLSPIPFLQPALDIPYCHHEKWDGSGYPRGLKREEIPLPARIFAVIDVWDALRSDRPYRPAWPEEKVLQHIALLSGSHFDPAVVETFLRCEVWRMPSLAPFEAESPHARLQESILAS